MWKYSGGFGLNYIKKSQTDSVDVTPCPEVTHYSTFFSVKEMKEKIEGKKKRKEGS